MRWTHGTFCWVVCLWPRLRWMHTLTFGDMCGNSNTDKNTHLHLHECSKDAFRLLPLLRVPVTSLCRVSANLTSPCLQRLAHPDILTVTRDTAG